MPFKGVEFKPCCMYCAVEWSTSEPIFITNCMHTTCKRCSLVPHDDSQEVQCGLCGNKSRLIEINDKAPQTVKDLFLPVGPMVSSMLRALRLQRSLRRSLIHSHERIQHKGHGKIAKMDEVCSYWKNKLEEMNPFNVRPRPNEEKYTYQAPSEKSEPGQFCNELRTNVQYGLPEKVANRYTAPLSSRDHEQVRYHHVTPKPLMASAVSPGILKYPPNTPLTGSESSGNRKRVSWSDQRLEITRAQNR